MGLAALGAAGLAWSVAEAHRYTLRRVEVPVLRAGQPAMRVLHVSDLQVADNVEILNEPETVLATVGIIQEEPVEETAMTEEEGAEPEVIGKGKKDDESEA